MALSEPQKIAIAELIFYIPALAVGVFLAVRHGFGRNIGWLYIVIFALCRIVGPGMTVGTISQPQNVSLYYSAAVLQTVGLSPLILVLLGLLGRVLENIRRSGTHPFLDRSKLRIVQLIILVGMILSAVGGSQAVQDYSATGVYSAPATQRAGMGLMIAAFGLLVLFTAAIGARASQVEPGEKRLLLAIALSLPPLLVRLVYSAVSVFAGIPAFVQYSDDFDANIQLGMMVVMEMAIVAIVEGVGLTLRKLPKSQPSQAGGGRGIWTRLVRPRPSQESQKSHEMRRYGQDSDTSYHA